MVRKKQMGKEEMRQLQTRVVDDPLLQMAQSCHCLHLNNNNNNNKCRKSMSMFSENTKTFHVL